MSLDSLSTKEKRIVKSSILIGGAVGTFMFYKAFGLFDLIDLSEGKKKTVREIIAELNSEINARCIFYDDMPSVIDEKTNSLELSKLYFYGFPYDFKRPAAVGPNSVPLNQGSEKPLISGGVIGSGSETKGPQVPEWFQGVIDTTKKLVDEINDSKDPNSNRTNTVISLIMKEAIDINSNLPMIVPDETFKRFMEEEYYKYKALIISSYENGIKLRIPHQPLISCLPLIVKLYEEHGYYFNEVSTLYRLIAYQKTLLRNLDTTADGKPIGDIIINGINIRTGKTVVEEKPPDNAVVIPTRGPEAGRVIPIGETAVI